MRLYIVSILVFGYERRDYGNVNDVNVIGWFLVCYGKFLIGEGGLVMVMGVEELRSFEIFV